MSFSKHIALTSLALLTFSGFASAADLGKRPAPAPAPVAYSAPPVFSWTGAYVGLNAGAAFGSPYSSTDVLTPVFSGTAATPLSDRTTYGSPRSTSFTGGGLIGYNWQVSSNFVVGAEADINFKGRGKNTFSGTAPAGPTGTTTTSGGVHTYSYLGTQSPLGASWYGTVRARLGLSVDRALFYVTGGLAFGGGSKGAKASYYDAYQDNNTQANNFLHTYDYSASNKTRAGWALGAGLNYAVTNNIIVGLEYLYIDLGKKTQTLNRITSTTNTNIPTSFTFKSGDRFSVVRGTVAYKF